MEIDNIYNMDCLEGMKQIPDGTIDAVICDLPYGTTQCPWDSVIPFDNLWEQYRRICKPNAPIVLFGQEPFSSALRMSNLKWYRYDWIWEKPGGSNFMMAKQRPLKVHEIISVFYKELGTYNPQPRQYKSGTIERGQRHISKTIRSGGVYGEKDLYREYSLRGDYGYPHSIVFFNNLGNNQFHKELWHPTQKPVDLLRYLVLTYTNEGDTVLDNCMGSGTTAIACIKEHRHFIGFELSKEYFDKAVKRIDTERRQLTLF